MGTGSGTNRSERVDLTSPFLPESRQNESAVPLQGDTDGPCRVQSNTSIHYDDGLILSGGNATVR